LASLGAGPDHALVCLESTGVYGEALCYWLHERGYRVVVEDAAKVRRAMPVAGAKTDALDARRIADYAARFLDELRPWTPSEAVVEQVRTLLTMREQLVRERGAKRNALHVLRRKAVPTPLAVRIAEDAVGFLADRIEEIDREVRRLAAEHPTIGPAFALLLSVPGVGPLLAAHVVVATGGFERALVAKRFSAYVGVCPLEHESGTSARTVTPAPSRPPPTTGNRLPHKSPGIAAAPLTST
jgi:transposase